MKPYYQDDAVTLYHADCRDVLPTFDNQFFSAIITSPPYNTGNKSLGYHPRSTTGDKFYGQYDDNKTSEEYSGFLFDCINKSLAASKLVFWNMQMLSGNKQNVIDVMFEYRKYLKDIFIWEKQAVSQIVKGQMAKGYEFVFCFGSDGGMVFKDANFPENNYVPNIKTFYKSESFKEHHATFPIELPSYFIQNFVPKDGTVCDIFAGTGTTLRAAKDIGRKAIGMEIEEKYCEIAAKRMQQEVLF